MYVLTVTETLEAWEDSVNIGTVSLRLLMNVRRLLWCASFSSCSAENQLTTSYNTLYLFLFMWQPVRWMETIWVLGYAVTTGACKSGPQIVAAVVLGCSILQLSVAWMAVSSFTFLCAQWRASSTCYYTCYVHYFSFFFCICMLICRIYAHVCVSLKMQYPPSLCFNSSCHQTNQLAEDKI